MTKLIIKKRGLFISIPGIPSFRTPAKVDITNANMELIIAELHKTGVLKYQIQTKDVQHLQEQLNRYFNKKQKSNVNIITEKDSILIDERNEEVLNLVKDQSGSIKKIEELLKQFLSSGSKDFNNEPNKIIKQKEERAEDFIPTINLDKIKLKGNSTRSIKSKTNFMKDAEQLSTVIDKKVKE
jgi:hypothetical protein